MLGMGIAVNVERFKENFVKPKGGGNTAYNIVIYKWCRNYNRTHLPIYFNATIGKLDIMEVSLIDLLIDW